MAVILWLPLGILMAQLVVSELSHSEDEWFRQIADGDTHAFTELFHHYNRRLFPFVRRLTKSEVIAEEIVQEVFLRLWVNREKMATMERPGAWLFLVASNLSMTHLRNAVNLAVKHAGAARISEAAVTDALLQELDGKEMATLVEAAVRQLPPKRQQIFRLSRQDGLTHQEIAEKLSISPHTVKDHLVLALKSIREYIHSKTGSSVGIILLLELLKK
jgi:RNA polymerase sigma-70 factor (ECF subfamily)